MERRYLNNNVQLRAEQDGQSRAIGGIAAMVDTPTVLWEYKRSNGGTVKLIEVIKPGAFDGVLGDDVRALFNHNDEKILGRTSAGTLKVYKTDGGHLGYDVPDVPDTTYGNDLLVSVERGDVTQSSFGFTIDGITSTKVESDNDITYTDEITRLGRLYDVSPVTFPAYEQTVTEKRQARIDQIRAEVEKPIEDNNNEKIEAEQNDLARRIKLAKHQACL